MPKPKALILRAAGTNCDVESAYAATLAGFDARCAHVNRLASGEIKLDDYSFLFVPGGFSYGDDIAAGKVMALELNKRLGDAFFRFEEQGKLILGVCNGFQVLIKTGVLPEHTNSPSEMRASLINNDSGKYEDRWVHIAVEPGNTCVFTRSMAQRIELPIAHAEGKFVVKDQSVLTDLKNRGQIVLRYIAKDGGEPVYPECPNGAMGYVAGVCNEKGTVFGLMPHPERFLDKFNHPRWTRDNLPETGDGFAFFKNAYDYCAR